MDMIVDSIMPCWQIRAVRFSCERLRELPSGALIQGGEGMFPLALLDILKLGSRM